MQLEYCGSLLSWCIMFVGASLFNYQYLRTRPTWVLYHQFSYRCNQFTFPQVVFQEVQDPTSAGIPNEQD
ncbi:hypothetical protein ACFX2I_003139 [Malus domestica]